jgi:hypothetical protein
VPAHVKILEIDPRGRNASWTGMDELGRRIARATVRAIKIKTAQFAVAILGGATSLH